MRIVVFASILAIAGAGWLLQAQPATVGCRLRIELVDAETGKPLAGLTNVTNAEGERIELEELLPRGLGLSAKLADCRLVRFDEAGKSHRAKREDPH